jgi:ABC-type multidrug transport system ATPase subunit
MSERILKALIQLFALVTLPGKEANSRRQIVHSFLNQQLNQQLTEEYLALFDIIYQEHIERFNKSESHNKRRSAVSVKILKITNDINEELSYYQKLIVIIQLFEFLNISGSISDIEQEFIDTVALSFNIKKDEFAHIRNFSLRTEEPNGCIVISGDRSKLKLHARTIFWENFDGEIHFLHIQSVNLFIFRFSGNSELLMNGQLLSPDRTYIMQPGSTLKNKKGLPIYYSDILGTITSSRISNPITLSAENIVYHFNKKTIGLQPLSFQSHSGQLVGIMGASGSGKSTLINLLSGMAPPSSGSLKINGTDIYDNPEKIKGLMGYVSQDDVLIEDLTVYDNLYYNAKLCFSNLTPFQLRRMVMKILRSLGLYQIRNMRVGSPMNKKISGGQRKRLNIGLELMREPSILFLDEPTSGLSSHDSENIVDLLKELTIKGKLVYVVIHQPSSDIFKMFDQLLILDTGGYLIYNGNPAESLNYFKSSINLVNRSENACHTCGNINVEQILNIVSAPVVDEYGNFTLTRKVSPQEWYNKFNSSALKKEVEVDDEEEKHDKKLPAINFSIPNRLVQFFVFLKRDLKAKLANQQYVFINLFETPILAAILALLIRYFNIDPSNTEGYSYSGNVNITVYIIISVIIAFFVGITLSSEEIVNDRKILRREAFLSLSKLSYLSSKGILLSFIIALQTFLYVLIGNYILEIKEMNAAYWGVLFSTSVSASILGLNLSDTFRKTVNIYIIIPFLVIPQLILSGVFVSFDRLNPNISSVKGVPWYGEMIIARWAFEAIATYQFMNNSFEKEFYLYDKAKSQASYYKDYWVPAMSNHLEKAKKNSSSFNLNIENLSYSLNLIRNEIGTKATLFPTINAPHVSSINPNAFNDSIYRELKQYLEDVKLICIKRYNIADDLHESKRKELIENNDSTFNLGALKSACHNDDLEQFIRNSTLMNNKILEYKNRLWQKTDPIFQDPRPGILAAHLFAPYKIVKEYKIETYYYNIAVIWIITLFLFTLLYFGIFSKILNAGKIAQFYIQRRSRHILTNKLLHKEK